MKKPIFILIVLAACAALFFFVLRSGKEVQIPSGTKSFVPKPAPDLGKTISAEKKSEPPPVKQLAAGTAVATDAPVDMRDKGVDDGATDLDEVTEEDVSVDEAINALDDQFAWESKQAAKLTKSVLLSAPPSVREKALERVTRSLRESLEKGGSEFVDLEMVNKAIEDAIPPDMPMRQTINDYIEDFEE